MKVLTLKQPWANLVAEGIKEYEFRSWKTNYRGRLLIHAGAGVDKEYLEKYKDLNIDFPSRKIVAEVELVDCLFIDEELNRKIINEKNIAYGSKSRTGYAWKIKLIRKIDSKKSVNGKLGLWNYEDFDE